MLRYLILVRHGEYNSLKFSHPVLTDKGIYQLRTLMPKLKQFVENRIWMVFFGKYSRHIETKDIVLEIFGDAPSECKDGMVGHKWGHLYLILEYIRKVIEDESTETLILSTSQPTLENLPGLIFENLIKAQQPLDIESPPYASAVVIDFEQKTMELICCN